MRKYLILTVIYFLFCLSSSSQNIIMPALGDSTITSCSAIFHGSDDALYPATDGTLTICSPNPGDYINLYFDSLNLYNQISYLFIYDGASTNAPILSGLTGTLTDTLIVASSSNSSGCLTLKYSTFSTYQDSWTCHISCGTTPSVPPLYDNRDCYKSTQICSDATFAGNNTSFGINELANAWIPCSYSGEMQASWYYFRVANPGSLGFTISPGPVVDYDFALWGPYNSLKCPVNTFDTPLRCSYSAQKGDTGLGNGAIDDSEGASGDKWVSPLYVNKNDVYVLYINNYSANSTPYNFIWDLSGGASIDCTPLPISLAYFEGKKIPQANLISWQTLSEKNTSIFELQRSENGNDFATIKELKAAGESKSKIDYEYTDQKILAGASYYYRLKQTDLDGHFSFSEIIFISSYTSDRMAIFPNPTQESANISIHAAGDDDAYIKIINATGQVVLEIEKNISKGANQFSMDVATLPKGIYILKLSSASGRLNIQERMIK